MRLLWFICAILWLLLLGTHPAAADDLTTLEQEIWNQTNQIRLQAGHSALRWDPILAIAARGHSQDMARWDFFDHDSPVQGKRQVQDRVRQAGAPGRFFSENLYWCKGLALQVIPKNAMTEWMNSADHRDNILSASSLRVGVGVARKGREVYITQVFGE